MLSETYFFHHKMGMITLSDANINKYANLKITKNKSTKLVFANAGIEPRAAEDS